MEMPRQTGNANRPAGDRQQRILAWIAARRGLFSLAAALGVAVFVALGHWLVQNQRGGRLNLLALLLAALAGAAAWALMNLTFAAVEERQRTASVGQLSPAFSQTLSEATGWDDLVRAIVAYPHQVAPEAQVTLYVARPGNTRLAPEASCSREGVVTLRPPLSISPDSLPVGSLPQLLMQQAPIPSALPPAHLPPHRYDLPITRSDQTIAVLKLEYPLRSAPTAAQLRTLQAAAPVIALALEVRLLQDVAARWAVDSAEERQRIAQTLHDTLAQNVGYLRLKLDQLTGENAIHEIGAVLQELERMRAAADEAYSQVRQTLDDLNAPAAADLPALLAPQAQAICRRAGLKLVIHENGAPFPLSATARQQVLYIAREALHNVEKHAGAAQVTLTYLWQPDGLVFKIHDDGTGFDPRRVDGAQDGHYGLWIMQQRAAEIGGTLRVQAAAQAGAEVTLWLPRAQPAGRGEAPGV